MKACLHRAVQSKYRVELHWARVAYGVSRWPCLGTAQYFTLANLPLVSAARDFTCFLSVNSIVFSEIVPHAYPVAVGWMKNPFCHEVRVSWSFPCPPSPPPPAVPALGFGEEAIWLPLFTFSSGSSVAWLDSQEKKTGPGMLLFPDRLSNPNLPNPLRNSWQTLTN